MNEPDFDNFNERTIDACAWLIGIAQCSVEQHGWDPVIVRYLERLGQATFDAEATKRGGMGAVAPMVTQHRH